MEMRERQAIAEHSQMARWTTSQIVEQGYQLFGQSSPEIFHRFEHGAQQLVMEFEQRLAQRQNDIEDKRLQARQDFYQRLEE